MFREVKVTILEGNVAVGSGVLDKTGGNSGLLLPNLSTSRAATS